MPNYITLANHEARRLAETGTLLVVRPVVPQPTRINDDDDGTWEWRRAGEYYDDLVLYTVIKDANPLGAPGDVLVCKEAWRTEDVPEATYSGAAVRYKADDGLHFVEFAEYEEWDRFPRNGKWRPASIMPAWAVRFRPVVREAGVMRVQDMTEEQCRDAGAWGTTGGYIDCQLPLHSAVFAREWNRRFRKHPWESNPWVWTAWVEEEQNA